MAVSGSSSTNLNLTKRLWGNDFAMPMYKASKALALIKKDTNFGGEGRYVVVSVAPPGGGSAHFPEAVANQTATSEVRFFVQHRNEYQIWSLTNEAIHKTRGDKNALIELVKHYLNRARYAYARAMARRFWGNRGGAMGQIAATQTLSSTDMVLRNRSDVAGFEVGQWYQFASTDGTGTSAAYPTDLRGGGTKLQVTSIDRGAAATWHVKFSAALDTVPSITANDFVFRAGDYAQARSGARGWGPVSNPSGGESFFGLDRTTTDIQRVSGARYSGSGAGKIETLIDGFSEAQTVGVGQTNTSMFRLFLQPRDFADIQKDRESVRQVDVETTSSKIGFKALQVATALGEVQIFSETDVPQGYGWAFDTDEIYSRTAGDDPMDLVGGNGLLVYQDQDSRQGRLGSYGNFFWENPGNQLILTF